MKTWVPLLIALLLFVKCTGDNSHGMKKDWSSTYRVESGKPVSMAMTAYKTTMIADGKDHTLIRVAVIDSIGKEIRSADTPFHIFIRGDATIAGTTDGSALTFQPGNDTTRFWAGRLVDGLCNAILQAGTTPDKIKVEVRADSLWPSSHEIHTIPPDVKLMTPDRTQMKPTRKNIDRMLGADISFLPQMESRGMKFIVNGEPTDAIKALADHGFNYIRLRIFVNPENEKGYSPQAGFCGLGYTLQMARRVKDAGMKLLLNFHYSDYWADPQQQNKPKAWENLDFTLLQDSMKAYTRRVLLALKEQGTLPDMVQVGNEVNHGMLWPDGHVSNLDNLAALLKAGAEAVEEVDPNIIVMMHIALGGQNDECVFWLDNMLARDVRFDILGLSYYPRWHGTLDDLQDNLHKLVNRYGIPVNVVEYSQYKKEVHDIVFSVPGDKGKGTCIWEPLWQMFGRDGVANEQLFVYREIAAKYYMH